ncbi:MAG: TetR/AcrR family transcriptional regulator [Chloroflexota bacterium]
MNQATAKQVTDKRQAILDATLTLISERGFHGTAMSQVAKEAKVSTGIIYHYFASKDELISELHLAIKHKIARATMQNFDLNEPVKRQIQQFLRNAIRYSIWHPQESAFIEPYDRSPYQHKEVDAEVSRYYTAMIACFEQAKKEQIIKDLPIPIIYLFTMGIATSLGQKHASGQLELTDTLIEQVIETSWEAIRG